MQDITNHYLEKVRQAFRRLKKIRLRKMHLDYIAGLLSIPVLIMAIIINFGNLNNKNKTTSQTPSPSPQIIVVPISEKPSHPLQNKNEPTATPQVCDKSIGPISITYPQEGQTISDNPACITITYSNPNYCSVVWSYSINGSSWSNYNTDTPCLYNLPNGNVQFQLRVNSTVSTDTTTLTRNFVYNGANNPVITPTSTLTPTPSPIPTLTFTPTPVASSSATTH